MAKRARFRVTNSTSPLTYAELVDGMSTQLMLEGFRIDKESLDFRSPQIFEMHLPDDEADILRGPFSDAKIVVGRETIVLQFKEMRKGEQSIKDLRAEELDSEAISAPVPAEAPRPAVHSASQPVSPVVHNLDAPHDDDSSSSSWSSWLRPMLGAPTFLLNGSGQKGRLESISEEPHQIGQETSVGKSVATTVTPSVGTMTTQATSGVTRPRPKRKVERPGSAPSTPTLPEREVDTGVTMV